MQTTSLLHTISQKSELGYRRFERLTKPERRTYTRSNQELDVKLLALKYRGVTGKSLEKSLGWAERNINRYNRYINKTYIKNANLKWILRNNRINRERLIEEFKFRGFVPESQFPRGIGNFYIISNVGGLIYPVKLKNGLGHPETATLFRRVGIPGFTQFDQSYWIKQHEIHCEIFSRNNR